MSIALVLRTCKSDLTSYNNFQYPESGYVEAPDWDPKPICGNGLHGLLWGEGDCDFIDWTPDAKWLVIEVEENDIVPLKTLQCVKFKCGNVIHVGCKHSSTNYILKHSKYKFITGLTINVGDKETAIVGERGIAIAGNYGLAQAGAFSLNGRDSLVIVGNYGTACATSSNCKAIAGDHGTAIVGLRGEAIAGNYGIATGGIGSKAIVGKYGKAFVDNNGTAIAGYGGFAEVKDFGTAIVDKHGKIKAGYGSKLQFKSSITNEYIISYTSGLLQPQMMYKLNENDEIVECN